MSATATGEQGERTKRGPGSGRRPQPQRQSPRRPQPHPQRAVKLERGARWFCGAGALLLAAACFFMALSWIAVGPAAAYRHGAECSPDAPSGASCFRSSTAVIESVHFNGAAGRGSYYWMVLEPAHAARPVTVHGVISVVTQPAAPKTGTTVPVRLWQGRVMTATSSLGTATNGSTPGQNLTAVFSCAVGLLLAALGCLRFSRPAWFGGRVGLTRRLTRIAVVAMAAAVVVLAVGGQQAGVYMATAGMAATVLWALPYVFAVFTFDSFQRHQVQAAGAGARTTKAAMTENKKTESTKTESKKAESKKPAQPAAEPPTATESRRSVYRNQDRRSDGCPVGEEDQAWIEKSLYWFTTQFGYDPVQRRTIVPTPDFVPAGYTGTDDEVRRLFALACPVMGTSADRVALRFVGEPSLDPEAYRYVVHRESFAAGVFSNNGSGYAVELDRDIVRDPRLTVATIAHELGHVRLNGDKGVDPRREDAERLTDLVTVFFGFGVFNADAAYLVHDMGAQGEIRRLGYMDQRMFGYALACYCRMRQSMRNPPWAEYLDAVPREAMRQGLEYLDKAAPYGGLPVQRG